MKQKKTGNMRKRLIALAAAAGLVLGMAAQVSAATITSDQGIANSSDTILNIEKTLKVTNPTLLEVAGPGLQLTYTIDPASVAAGTVINDGTNTANVQPGPEGGLTLGSAPSYTVSELLNASESGANNVKNIVLNADLTKFAETGVYRYVLTDTTTPEALAAAGVERSADFTNVRYVDVYVQRTQGSSTLSIEGYVVGSDNDEDGNLAKETFDYSSTDEDTSALDYQKFDTRDVFNTYNLRLQKLVGGAMGNRRNEFPFAITVSDSGRAYYAAKGAAPTSTTTSTDYQAAHTTSLSTTLKHEDIYYIAGLRKNDTVAYTETNNTNDDYSVSITGGTPSAASNVSPGGSKAMAATLAPNATDVTFNNNHGSVSPTGVIMRFGPYIGMIALAVILIAVRRRARRA